jgi:hypothetical protein
VELSFFSNFRKPARENKSPPIMFDLFTNSDVRGPIAHDWSHDFGMTFGTYADNTA